MVQEKRFDGLPVGIGEASQLGAGSAPATATATPPTFTVVPASYASPIVDDDRPFSVTVIC